jgi:magnesium chelatase family protein
MVQRYLHKISGPLMDRIDMHLEVTPVSLDQMMVNEAAENSKSIRERVIKARESQSIRFQHNPEIYSNAMMPTKMVKESCVINSAGRSLLRKAIDKLGLSARAYTRILKVSRTIADLSGSSDIKVEHLAEAIHYRTLDRAQWV